uniref:3-demethylubiquinol 3-O-methyltransferase n=1 Tax=Chaetoceros debilis TaxID=122233 RepID=A0A7S3PXG3_9STRA
MNAKRKAIQLICRNSLLRLSSSQGRGQGQGQCQGARRALRTNNNGCRGQDVVTVRAFSSSQSSSSTSTSTSNNSNATTTSVSSEEVSKFSSMASTWWKVEHNPLISMNPIRMSFITQQIADHIQSNNSSNNIGEGVGEGNISYSSSGHGKGSRPYQPLKGLKALDVGCGGGLLSESLARLGADVTAIDPSVEVAKAAQIHSQSQDDCVNVQNINYRGGISVEDLGREYSDNSSSGNENLFDIVCVLEVIEHASDPNSLMQAASSLLKKPTTSKSINAENTSASAASLSQNAGGMLFVSTINRTAKSYGIAILGGEYITGKLPIGTHSWNKFLSPQEVEGLVGEFGIKEVERKGMILQPPFYDLRWYLDGSDYDVNWIGSYAYP